MKLPQDGLFDESSCYFHALEYGIKAGVPLSEIRADLDRVLAKIAKPVYCIVGFGENLWRLMNPEAIPANLATFTTIKTEAGYHADSSQSDIVLWLHSEFHDELVEAVIYANTVMAPSADLYVDLPGFRYRDSRDLTGFVDGTANPKGDDRQQVALIPAGESGEGGAYMMTQKWVHKLQAFKQLSVTEQEKVIGRTKTDNVELEGDDMPPTSHVARTDLKENGKGVKIYRRSFPYASAGEQGLYFIAFSAEFDRFDKLLRRMFGTYGDNLSDKLLDYSDAVKNAYWFVPSQGDLLAAIQK